MKFISVGIFLLIASVTATYAHSYKVKNDTLEEVTFKLNASGITVERTLQSKEIVDLGFFGAKYTAGNCFTNIKIKDGNKWVTAKTSSYAGPCESRTVTLYKHPTTKSWQYNLGNY